jgi:hypothetical protein
VPEQYYDLCQFVGNEGQQQKRQKQIMVGEEEEARVELNKRKREREIQKSTQNKLPLASRFELCQIGAGMMIYVWICM